ncbi:hypothetical protein ACSVC9_11700 [Clostridium sp. LBM24168]
MNDHSDRLKKIENQNMSTAKDVQNFKDTFENIKELIEKMTIQLENLKENPAKIYCQNTAGSCSCTE